MITVILQKIFRIKKSFPNRITIFLFVKILSKKFFFFQSLVFLPAHFNFQIAKLCGNIVSRFSSAVLEEKNASEHLAHAVPAKSSNPGSSAAGELGEKCIKILQEAERNGALIIKEARERRIKRLKAAKWDADKEIVDFRRVSFNFSLQIYDYDFQKKEAIIQEKLYRIERDNEEDQVLFDKEIDEILQAYDERVHRVKDQLISNILELVVDIHPTTHHNFIVHKEIDATGTFTRIYDHFEPVPCIKRRKISVPLAKK